MREKLVLWFRANCFVSASMYGLYVVGVILFCEQTHAQLPTVEDLLARHRAGQQWKEHFQLQVQQLEPSRAFMNPGMRDEEFVNEAIVRGSGGKIRWTNTQKGRPQPREFLLTQVDDKDTFFEWTDPQGVVVYRGAPRQRGNFWLSFVAGPTVSGVCADTTLDWVDSLRSLDGLTVREGEVNGASCYILEGDTPGGRVRAALDPSQGYSLVQYSCELEPGKHMRTDGFNGKDKVYESADPNKPVHVMRFELERATYREIDGVFVPEAAITHVTTEYEGGTPFTYSTGYKVTSIDLSPEFSASTFAPDFPDGTKLRIFREKDGGLMTGFEWKGGRIVPAVSDRAIAAVNKSVSALKNGEAPETAHRVGLDPGSSSDASASAEPSPRRLYALLLLIAGASLIGILVIRRLSGREARKRSDVVAMEEAVRSK